MSRWKTCAPAVWILKISAPTSNKIAHRLLHPGAVDVGEAEDRGTNEVPGAVPQREIEVRDETVLGEVQFDVVEQFRPNQRPEL